jgi:hypothetical protein
MRNHFSHKKFIAIVVSVVFYSPLFAFASTGTIDSVSKYAWGNDIGWINFNPTNGNVAVSDSGLSGYAWSQNYGWINLAPINGGVMNDGEGDLSGFAWGENIGWINFSGVTINTSTGAFTGVATTTSLGNITFDCTNCGVVTTWRSSSSISSAPPPPVSVSGGGGGGGSLYFLPTGTNSSPSSSISSPVSIASMTNTQLEALLASLEAELQALLQQAAAQGIGVSSSASSTPLTFGRNLNIGLTGTDVQALQHYLNTHGFPITTISGNPGSLGHETLYFGTKTKQALAAFQKNVGIVPSYGFFGPITRAYVNGHR